MKCWPVAARRGASASPSSSRTSTRAPEPVPSGGGDPACRQRLPRSHRLTRGAELRRVATEGKRIRTRHLEVRALASPLAHSRVGLVVAKHGHGSVERNQLKRRLRELSRTVVLPRLAAAGSAPRDVVIRTRREAYQAGFDDLRAELARVVVQLSAIVDA
ncbi:MAG: ribonuclease P protein component [Gemmatimonadaceae bacterium]